jgi:hypothetical protein
MSFIAESFTALKPTAVRQLIRLNIKYRDMMGLKKLSVSEHLAQFHGRK